MARGSLYRSRSLETVGRELVRYRLDLVGAVVMWHEGSTELAKDDIFVYGNGN